jgi:hypothetical protein
MIVSQTTLAEVMAEAVYEKLSKRAWKDQNQKVRDEWTAAMQATLPIIGEFLLGEGRARKIADAAELRH